MSNILVIMELINQYTNNKVSFENGSLKYNSMISLLDITSVRIVTILWMHEKSNLFRNVKKISRSSFEQVEIQRIEMRDWYNANKNVLSKLSRLPLPKAVLDICWFDSISALVGSALKVWVDHHQPIFPKINKYFDDIKWTAKGGIDYKKTACHIMQRRRLSLECRLELACMYCIEEEIDRIFPAMKRNYFIELTSKHFMSDKPMLFYFMNNHLDKDFWEMLIGINDLTAGQGSKTVEEYVLQKMLEYCEAENESDHLLVGLKYLWDKLTIEEKSNNIINLIKYCGNNDLRYSILSELNGDFQKQVIEKTYAVFFDMPYYWHSIDYFLPTIIFIFDVLTKDAYADILKHVISSMYYTSDLNHISNKANVFKGYFKVLWENSPKHLQESLLEKNDFIPYIALLAKENIDLAHLMLYDIQDVKKDKAIFSTEGLDACENIILKEDEGFLFLNNFMECFLHTEEKINMFKSKIFLLKGINIIAKLLESKKWNQTEFFMKWALGSAEKVEIFKKDIMIQKKPYNEYEISHPHMKYLSSIYLGEEDDIRSIEKIFSKSIL